MDTALAKAITAYKAAVRTGQLPAKVETAKRQMAMEIQATLDMEAA